MAFVLTAATVGVAMLVGCDTDAHRAHELFRIKPEVGGSPGVGGRVWVWTGLLSALTQTPPLPAGDLGQVLGLDPHLGSSWTLDAWMPGCHPPEVKIRLIWEHGPGFQSFNSVLLSLIFFT